MTPTQQRLAAFNAVAAMAETIRKLGSVPAGTMYANLVDQMDLPTFTRMIEVLKGAGLVAENSAHLLMWTGPRY
jgi:hypothetical protein